jgi:hypothetical protein
VWRNSRDSQRQRAYSAELAVRSLSPTFDTFKQVEKFVNKVLRSPWLQSNYPIRDIIVIDVGNRNCQALARPWSSTIAIPAWARSELIVLHEISHLLTKRQFAAHGPEFIKCFLRLVKHFMGETMHNALLQSFKLHKVRIKPKATRTISIYQRQILRERIKHARECKVRNKVAADSKENTFCNSLNFAVDFSKPMFYNGVGKVSETKTLVKGNEMNLEAHVHDPMVEGGKSVMVKEGGEEHMPCATCGIDVNFAPHEIGIVDKVACSPECAIAAFPSVNLPATVVVKAQTNTDVCSVCGGPSRGRGYTHTPECTFNKKIKSVATCPECGGPRKGRGFGHTDNCPLVTRMKMARVTKSKSTRVCHQCGGPARGRGFAHTAECPALKPKQNGSQAKTFCAECGGPALGRGFAHLETCSLFKKKVETVKRVCYQCGGPARGRGFTHNPDCPALVKKDKAPVVTAPVA